MVKLSSIQTIKFSFSQIHEVEGTKKLTGRQLFLRDSTLNLSDVALMQAAGNEIEFDESLFDEVGFIKILP
ncbi:unnamed protein product [Brugia timori]|uniref:PIN domain-containing protein n=1 Tax=Brugia timori TaxID=42155 RepID=A0A0R3R017_9BILA|nr:unnamed protein product [Brugia timori]